MNIKEFFEQEKVCKICSKPMSAEAGVAILVDRNAVPGSQFSYAGIVQYNYDGKKFIRHSFQSEFSFEKMMDKIYSNLPKSMIMRQRVCGRINKTKISELIEPWFVTGVEATLFKKCVSDNHSYTIRTTTLYQNDYSTRFELGSEYILTNNYSIINPTYSNNYSIVNSYSNRFSGPVTCIIKKIADDKYSKTAYIPFIPMSKWNINDLDGQVSKYLILK